jgi:hypothetical protein
MSTFDFKAIYKPLNTKVTGTTLDDYFGKHQYGYRVSNRKRVMSQKTFYKYYIMIEEPEDQQGAANALQAFFDAEEPKPDDPREREFILTDGCMWEANRKGGTFHPHAIEVVDTETGQVRYIESGARIKFVEGSISQGRDQQSYNKHHKEV